MAKHPTWLLDCQANVFSQAGEDGVIEKILELLPDKNHWCVEFGAWDGILYSNTRNLIVNKKYSAVLIESDREKFKVLEKNYSQYPGVVTVNRFVGFGNHDHLDMILEDTAIPKEFDFLSIDIDGNDYHVWKAAENYHPKVVCIEFNPTIPTEVNFVQSADQTVTQGCSLSALTELGMNKGYELVSVLPFNAIFVRKEYFPIFEISDNSPGVLRTHTQAITYMFSGYDGRIILRGHRRNDWHNIEISEDAVQILPRFLRKYPLSYNKVEKFLFNFLYKNRKTK
jgi:hypothetical protein